MQERHQAAGGGGERAGGGRCGIQEDRLRQPGGATARSGAGCWATGEPGEGGCPRPQAERSGPLSSVLGLPEGSSLQRKGAVPQLTVSYLWF